MRCSLELSFLVTALCWSNALLCQTTHKPNVDIIERLLVREFPLKVRLLDQTERADAVRQLQAAQPAARGKRSQEIAFLLASLGSNYSSNRDHIIKALRACGSAGMSYDCSEDLVVLLIGLYESGHYEVLSPLLVVGRQSDAALSEMLGDFYSSVLRRTPVEFIHAIRSMTVPVQEKLCALTGSTDGSGMSPADLNRVRNQLNQIGGDVAVRCLWQIERANKPE